MTGSHGTHPGGARHRSPTTRRWGLVLLAAAAVFAPAPAGANGESAAAPLTVFERFVLSACAPCVRETYPVAAIAVPPLARTVLGETPRGAVGRPGQIDVEVLRASQPGQAGWASLALRVTLSIRSGPGDELYRLGSGLLDGADVAALARAVDGMARSAGALPASGDPSPATVDVEFHGGTLRVGVVRARGQSVAYVQTGDLPAILQRAVWEVPTTLYIPVEELPTMAAALARAAATIEQVRGR